MRRCLFAANLVGMLWVTGSAVSAEELPVFTDVTNEAGITFIHSFGDDNLDSIVETTGASYDEAADLIARAGGSVKTAIVMKKAGLDRADADTLLAESGGFVRRALSRYAKE